jgi:hypothetical protein
LGEVQPAQVALSTLHSKLEPASVAVKEKLAVVAVMVPLGPLEIVVFGGVVSAGGVSSAGGRVAIVQFQVAGVESTLPAASLARTENWCALALRPV